ncbi:MAG: DNA repair protein RadA [Patescibacteria group bacterium]|nr:DNA repair protein RadA [Patescibacteria group bacterium]MCL5095246.1 DNA repair protein RadA [Patescibacteria group bacterium]
MKTYSKFICQQCGYESASWLGKCPNCGTWNSLVETAVMEPASSKRTTLREGKINPQKLSEIKSLSQKRILTGLEELDRVLGGGIVPGSVVLLAGNPGIGKSTLLLQICAKLGGLYVCGEESPEQVKIRAERLKIKTDSLLLFPEIDADIICTQIQELKPLMVIIDSIQTLETSDLTGASGSVGQIRECATRLTRVAKQLGVPIFLIGHVTKEGAIAGPMVLEHLVDTVLILEGEKFYPGRTLHSLKNRFGPTDEVGIFQIEDGGMVEIKNPSALFLQEREKEVPGSVVVPLLEGTRPILVEIQALAVPTNLAFPRRIASGFDQGRLTILAAIINRRLGLPLQSWDIFVNIPGGLVVHEPAADLGVALAIISSFKGKALPSKSFVFGEVGLLGEIRKVIGEEKRVKEARRLGFTIPITPTNVKTLVSVSQKILR